MKAIIFLFLILMIFISGCDKSEYSDCQSDCIDIAIKKSGCLNGHTDFFSYADCHYHEDYVKWQEECLDKCLG